MLHRSIPSKPPTFSLSFPVKRHYSSSKHRNGKPLRVPARKTFRGQKLVDGMHARRKRVGAINLVPARIFWGQPSIAPYKTLPSRPRRLAGGPHCDYGKRALLVAWHWNNCLDRSDRRVGRASSATPHLRCRRLLPSRPRRLRAFASRTGRACWPLRSFAGRQR